KTLWAYFAALMGVFYWSTSALIRSRLGLAGQEIYWKNSVIWSKFLLRLSGIEVKITGLNNLEFSGPKVYIANHQSNFDIPCLMSSIERPFSFIVKKELFKVPIMGWYMKKRGDISVDRKNPRSAMKTLVSISKRISAGEVFLIFPEGTRSLDGKVGEFKKGSLFLAVQNEAKIIPIGISGSINIQKKGSHLIKPSMVTINIGIPIKASKELENATIRQAIISLMAQK
ncbi:MAG: lysophospholipid acyltransferase family protein, partial [Candidatus Margulisiibacteriota bacterium]